MHDHIGATAAAIRPAHGDYGVGPQDEAEVVADIESRIIELGRIDYPKAMRVLGRTLGDDDEGSGFDFAPKEVTFRIVGTREQRPHETMTAVAACAREQYPGKRALRARSSG